MNFLLVKPAAMESDNKYYTGKVVLPNAMIFFTYIKVCTNIFSNICIRYREIESAVNYFQITFTTPPSFKSEWIIYFSYTRNSYIHDRKSMQHTRLTCKIYSGGKTRPEPVFPYIENVHFNIIS